MLLFTHGKVALIALCVAAPLLAGCQTADNMKAGVSDLKGKPYQYAFSVLGIPDDEKMIAGNRVFTWRTGWSGSYSSPTYQTGTATVNGRTVALGFTGTETHAVSYDCKIVVMAGPSGVIERSQYEGNIGGCERWARKFAKK